MSESAYANTGAASDGDSAIDSSGPSLEVDSDDRSGSDRDSALGDNQSTYTMSATSSVYNFKFENGRRYHAYSEGKYPIPNDEVEADRLDLQHQAYRLTIDGKLYLAPIADDVQHVLDVGCGTGIWTIEFADDHPSASVIGTDLSPIQPTSVPPNCTFLIDDCDQDWIFHNLFDYIHTRAMVAAIKNWDRFFEQAYANLKPGGYIECQEITFPMLCHDPTITASTSPVLRWSKLFVEAAATTGLDATAPNRLGPKLRGAGFVDVHAKCYKWPVGKWAKGKKMKLLGYYVYEDVMDWLPSSAMGLFTRVLKWSREEVELFLVECRRDLKDRSRHFYANCLFWTARKPSTAEYTPPHPAAQEFFNEEESLSADDSSQDAASNPATTDPAPTTTSTTADASTSTSTSLPPATAADPGPSSISKSASPGILIDPTSALSLSKGKTPEREADADTTSESESRKSMLSMEEMLNPAPSGSGGSRTTVASGSASASVEGTTTTAAVGTEGSGVEGAVRGAAAEEEEEEEEEEEKEELKEEWAHKA